MLYDVVIIGSGASGGAVAYTLCKAGYKVAVLEKGRLIGRDEFTKDELAYCRRDLVTPNLFDEYHTIEEKIDGKWVATPTYESGWSFWNGNIVGGSSESARVPAGDDAAICKTPCGCVWPAVRRG